VAADLYLGIDTGGTAAKFVLTAADGTVVVEGEVPTDSVHAAITLDRVAAAVGAGDRGSLVGVGLACAGIVTPGSGRLGRSPNLPGWENSDLVAPLVAAFGPVPVTLVNDVNSAIYGEYRAGAGRGCRDLVMLALGTGVGGGIIQGGRLLEGRRGGAAELGHMVLDPHGPTCTCGNRGCLEAWAGSVALLKRARALAADGEHHPVLAQLVAERGEDLETRDLARLADAGDQDTLDIFAEAGRRLGQAVGNLINTLDPDRVILGGGVARAGDLVFGPLRATYPPLVLCEASSRIPVVPAELGPTAAAVGAAWLAREQGAAG